MKSKRAEEFINGHIEIGSLQFTVADIEYCAMLAEQDAEEEVTRYHTELEESKKREELARKVIDDQRKEMEKLKARAVEAHMDCCRNFTKQCKCWDMDRGFDTPHTCNLQCSYMEKFIQKLNEK